MSKLTIFFIIATVLIVSVTGTLLGYKYFTAEKEIANQVGLGESELLNPEEKPEEEVVPEPKSTPTEAPPSMPDPFALRDDEVEEEPVELREILAGVDEEMISEERIMDFVEGEGCFSITIQRVIDRRPRKGWAFQY